MTTAFTVVIPSRYASTRLPGKPLQMIGTKPMIQLVWEQACKSSAERVVLLLDNTKFGVRSLSRIFDVGEVDVLVTDHGIAVNPARQDLIDNLRNAGIPLMTIEELQQRAELLTGKPKAIEFTDRVVAVVRYRDGSVIDVIHQVKNSD